MGRKRRCTEGAHHWVIPADGNKGTCKYCGQTKQFISSSTKLAKIGGVTRKMAQYGYD